MEGANKALALMLGLLVVLFLVAMVLGKVGPFKGPIAGSPFGRALGLRQPSPTPTTAQKKETALSKIKKTTSNQDQDKTSVTVNKDGSITVNEKVVDSGSIAGASTKGGAKKIPSTGVSAILYPIALVGLGVGLYLRKKGKRL